MKSSLKIRRTMVFGMPSVSAINRDVTFRSSLTILSTAAMLSSVRLAVGRQLRSSSFTDSLPSRNRLCHSELLFDLMLHHPLLNQFHSLCSRKIDFTAKFNHRTLFLLNNHLTTLTQ